MSTPHTRQGRRRSKIRTMASKTMAWHVSSSQPLVWFKEKYIVAEKEISVCFCKNEGLLPSESRTAHQPPSSKLIANLELIWYWIQVDSEFAISLPSKFLEEQYLWSVQIALLLSGDYFSITMMARILYSFGASSIRHGWGTGELARKEVAGVWLERGSQGDTALGTPYDYKVQFYKHGSKNGKTIKDGTTLIFHVSQKSSLATSMLEIIISDGIAI